MNSQISAAPIFEINPPATSVQLNTPLAIALGHAYERFAQTGQDLKNFDIQISERTRENGEDENGENTIGIAFVAKLEPGKKGLGNANRLGRSVLYIASRTSGEILREAGSR
ncbi:MULTISPECIES: hypothetical protein [unclassified Variovorax]|uniref:hypothetical protein n=1 Tax=unclassified Variovorax TaxID=663243 RepID=UPI003077379D